MSSKFMRFAVTGISCAFIYFYLSYFIVSYVGVRVSLAGFLAYSVVLPVNYLLHKYWSFRSRTLHRESVPKFVLVVLGGIVLNSVLIEVFMFLFDWHYLLVQFSAAAVVIAWNLALFSAWVFVSK
jgi:putative flippase GtrA